VVLCLTIFGLLSFTTAFADKRLADRTLSNVQDFYLADMKAEETLAAVYAEVYNQIGGFTEGGGQSFADFVRAAVSLPDVDKLEISESQFAGVEAARISYHTQMNDIQDISSEIILFYNAGRLAYRITQWNVVLSERFEFDYQGVGKDIWTPEDDDGFWFPEDEFSESSGFSGFSEDDFEILE
jgi:hypothetical protein